MSTGLSSKIIFLIPASTAFENEIDRSSQLETWCRERDKDWQPIWIRGDSALSKFSPVDNTLFVKCEESYQNILKKTILAARWVIENYDFEFVVRSNVSTYFDRKLTEKVFLNFDPDDKFFAGFIDYAKLNEYQTMRPERFVTGTGIVMTKSALEVLASADWTDYKSVPDDVAITRIFTSQSIACIPMNRCNLGTTRLFIPTWQVRLKSSTDSMLASRRFHIVHRFFQSTNVINRIFSYICIENLEIRSWNRSYDSFYVYLRSCAHLIKLNLKRILNLEAPLE